MQVLWAGTNPRGNEYQSKESQCHQANGSTKMQEGTRDFPRYGELPEVLLQLAYTGGRIFKRALRNDTL